jgi:hypothetical protein
MSRNYVAKNANISNLTSRKCDGLDSKGFLTIFSRKYFFDLRFLENMIFNLFNPRK